MTSLLGVGFCLAVGQAWAEDYTYVNTNGTICLTRYTGTGGDVAIPGEIGGVPVASIGEGAFRYADLTSITIPENVTTIGDWAFFECGSLSNACFEGNAPVDIGGEVFAVTPLDRVHYLPGTTGWGTNYSGKPTALWARPAPVILHGSASIQTNAFGFRISWATNVPVVVEASESLMAPNWSAVSTNTLNDGWCDFRDPDWTNHPNRFYRVKAQ